MNIFFVKIVDVYFDMQKIEIANKIQRFTGVYKSEQSSRIFLSNLKILILNDKNDGISIDTNSIDNLFFVEIQLFLGINDIYKIDYIEDYLNDNYKNINKNELSTKDNINDIISLKFENPNSNTLNNIIKILTENNISDYLISTHTSIYEWGCGDFFESFIISLSVDASKSFFKKIYALIKNKDSNGKVYVTENIKIQAANILGYTIDNYEIISLNKIKSEGYQIKLSNSYKELNIISDENSNIINLEVINLEK